MLNEVNDHSLVVGLFQTVNLFKVSILPPILPILFPLYSLSSLSHRCCPKLSLLDSMPLSNSFLAYLPLSLGVMSLADLSLADSSLNGLMANADCFV